MYNKRWYISAFDTAAACVLRVELPLYVYGLVLMFLSFDFHGKASDMDSWQEPVILNMHKEKFSHDIKAMVSDLIILTGL